MLTRLKGGKVFDPASGCNGEIRDIYFENGRIVAAPRNGQSALDIDVSGHVVMAGAIDLHTHIGGGKMNIARALLPEDHRSNLVVRSELTRSGCGHAAPSTLTTGYRYAEMGYTACFEPAMLPVNARHAHLEMGDTPIVDKGAYAMLGSDDLLLRMLAACESQQAINDYVAWTLDATQAIAIKVVNPGAINAFKFNARKLDLDERAPHYGVTPRQVLRALVRAVYDLGVPHPLHVHGSNLGVPGNVQTTLDTMESAEGLPLHLTHVQFHSYGNAGKYKFSSGAEQIAAAVKRHPNISVDVGQIMFGLTVTASGDTMSQYRNRAFAHPKKSVIMDIECDAGCGVVPFRYRDKNFVNALQWAIGLELFLMIDDPWRIYLTTDHPNGAPFTSYPHLIRLLMDKSFRADMLARIHPDAAAASSLAGFTREYTLYEIAVMTRAAPARSLGLADKGHLAPGAAADITVYGDLADREAMFARPLYVFKDGELVVRDGSIVRVTQGATHTIKPEYDGAIEKRIAEHFEGHGMMKLPNFKVAAEEICECGGRIHTHTCHARTAS